MINVSNCSVVEKIILDKDYDIVTQSYYQDLVKHLKTDCKELSEKCEKLKELEFKKFPLKDKFKGNVNIKYDIITLYGCECTEINISGLNNTIQQNVYLIRDPNIYFDSYIQSTNELEQIKNLLKYSKKDFVDVFGYGLDKHNLKSVYIALKYKYKKDNITPTVSVSDNNYVNKLLQ